MGKNDDNDIKIFKPKKPVADPGVADILEGMNYHRQNGNVDKAKLLGKELFSDSKIESLLAGIDLSEETVFLQAYSLLLFSAEAALNYYLPSPQLSTIAINSLHECITQKQSKVYSEIMNGSAFSFYYLNVRKGGSDVPGDIGKTYAMLCKREEDSLFIDQGKKIYLNTLSLVKKTIVDFSFSN